MERTFATEFRIAAERMVREHLGHCYRCDHDLPGVSMLAGGKWHAFCTECRFSVEADDVDELDARWTAAA